MIKPIDSIRVSERVFDLLDDDLADLNFSGFHLNGYLQTFHNRCEQGFYLTICDADYEKENRVTDDFYVWIFECRDGDEIMVVVSKECPNNNNGKFDEAAYKKAQRFAFNEEHEAAKYALDCIRDFLKV